jgi:hypothetical protein
MPYAKLRNLAKYGIIPDIEPTDLPPEAFSAGVNVRFDNGRIERAPVFRNISALTNANPRHVTSQTAAGTDNIYVAYKNGRVFKWTTSAESDQSIAGYVDADSDSVWTTPDLASVLYFNREDRVPWALTPGTSQFVTLANWTSTHRCKSLRTYNDALIAINVTKAGVNSPKMVKTSSIATDGAVPASWDHTTPGTNATENILARLKQPLIDGLALKETFYLYSQAETWAMQADGSDDVYAYREVFGDRGAINTNCVTEFEGKHAVFGTKDIWIHDGVSPRSISDGRVRKFVFGTINASKATTCFTAHNPNLKEIAFCFVSGDRLCAFKSPAAGCNRAAVWNYVNDTWTFYDLPLVFASTFASVSTSPTWATVTATWATVGGTWFELEDGFKKGVLFVGVTAAAFGLTAKLYGHDPYLENSVFAFPVDAAATPGAQLERDGIDLDELGAELRGYKQFGCVYPQGRVDLSGAAMEFAFGAADAFNKNYVLSAYQTFNGDDLNKVDFRDAGHVLAMRLRYNDYRTMSLSGLDVDLTVTGER